MAHDHDHSNCSHDHDDNRGPKKFTKPDLGSLKLETIEKPPVHATEHTFKNAVNNFRNDVKWMFEKGHNQYVKDEPHGDHVHKGDPKVTSLSKVAYAAGATVSLGVAIHGLVNVKRGLTGWHDKTLDEQHGPSAQYTIVGAAETVGGLALAKRLLTGTFRIF